MVPYGRYRHLLFNRYDRIEQATGRAEASPLQHLAIDRATLRDSLFPLVVVLSDTADATLTVIAPDGEELDRLRSTHMDRSRGDHARVRRRYGAEPGTYRIGVYGAATTEYELTAIAVEADGVLVDETRSGAVEAGEHHTYGLTVPAETTGSLQRDGRSGLGPALVGGAAAGGVALGAVGLHVLNRLRDRT
jgi:hypothetical protein